MAYHRALWLAGAVDHLGDALLRCAEYATQRSRSTTEHLLLFVLQLAIGGTLYFILSAWDHVIATSLFMCFLAPAAAAAGAMTSLMDGDTGFATGYTIVTHGLICLVAPFLLPLLDSHSHLPFWTLSGR